MGSDSEFRIPIIELTTKSKDLGRGTEGWESLCKRVREACENYGCFQVVYDKISSHLREEPFSLIRELFNLPLETKRKNVNPKPLHGYYEPGGEFLPFYESFGLEDASNCNSVKSFAELMWIHGHDHFCQTINTLMKEMEELSHMIGLMIIDSYGLGDKPESMMTDYQLLRVMKYLAPPSREYTNVASPHTDKFCSALLCEDRISALEIETKDGEWVKLCIPPRFLRLYRRRYSYGVKEDQNSPLGFALGYKHPSANIKAWSNGRMHATKHRVMLSGDEDRYSLGAFTVPVEGTIIKAAKEMVDEEHPQVFKDFDFMDFVNYANSDGSLLIDSAKKLFLYAALPRN